jgi:hypothetical protein
MGACMAMAASMLLAGCHLEQVQLGQVFIVYTPPSGTCPVLQWQFVVEANRTIAGTLLSNARPLGRLAGRLNPDDSYRMDVAAAGGPTTTVTGAITSEGARFTIDGDAAGLGCNGQTLYLHGGRLFQGSFYGGGGSA